MRDSLWQKRIPTLLGLLLLGVGIVTASWLVSNGSLFTTQASPDYQPENIRISNLSDTSFTVSYTTQEEALGTLSYSTKGETKIALDDRDQQAGSPRPYTLHHITVRNLEPQSNYSFTITSNEESFTDNGNAFKVATLAPLTSNPPPQPPIVGKVNLPNGSSAGDVMIMLVSQNAQVLSTLTKEDGNYVLPLNSIRTADMDFYLTLEDNSEIKMLLTNGTLSSNVSLLASQINPVPPITLSQNYNFSTTTEPVEKSSGASSSAEQVNFPSFSSTQSTASEQQPKIISPTNQEEFSDQQPSFSGTALPGEEVEILIHSEQEITSTVQANSSGQWSFRPDTALEPGEHTLTVKTKDKEGILRTLTRSFTVYAQGSQFVEPSVSPTQPTPTPTLIPTSTPTPVASVSATPTPIVVEVTEAPPPPTGPVGSETIVIFGILASLAMGVGSLLILTNRGR